MATSISVSIVLGQHVDIVKDNTIEVINFKGLGITYKKVLFFILAKNIISDYFFKYQGTKGDKNEPIRRFWSRISLIQLGY